jgi:hypothetical protein
MKKRLRYLAAVTLLLLIAAGDAIAQRIERQVNATTGAGGLNLSRIQIDYTVGEPVVLQLRDSIRNIGLTQGFLQPPTDPYLGALKEDMKLYPNPANSYTKIDFNLDVLTKVVEVRVTNIWGQEVFRDKVLSPPVPPSDPPVTYWKMIYQVNTRNFIPGAYVVSIKTDKGLSVTKMLIRLEGDEN